MSVFQKLFATCILVYSTNVYCKDARHVAALDSCVEGQILKFHRDLSSYWTACGSKVRPLPTEATRKAAAACDMPPISRGGSGWYKCDVRIPPPPVIPRPLSDVEPPRDVPAELWRPSYCRIWDDGCTDCKRVDWSREATCNAIHSVSGECKRHPVICSGAGTSLLVAQFCRKTETTVFQKMIHDKRQQKSYKFLNEYIWLFEATRWMWVTSGDSQVVLPDGKLLSWSKATSNDKHVNEQLALKFFRDIDVDPDQEVNRLNLLQLNDDRCVEAVTSPSGKD